MCTTTSTDENVASVSRPSAISYSSHQTGRKTNQWMPQQGASRIEQHIGALHTNPRPPGVKKPRGQTRTYRLRVGIWPLISTIDDSVQEILLVTRDDRKDVYRSSMLYVTPVASGRTSV